MQYVGGKNQAGTWQRLVNLIPPHRTYLEPFVGSGAILRLKEPAEKSIAVDQDPAPLAALRSAAPNLTLLQECGISFLERYAWRWDEFVYCDPPYLLSTRGGRKYYRHEMTDADHVRLLSVLKKIPAPVMLSGYASKLYDNALVGWNREEFTAYTRQHKERTEVLWFNYPRPTLLHDLGHVGDNFRERWRIEKRRRRQREKFSRMPALERASLFAALVDVMGPDALAIVANAKTGVAGS